MKIHGMNGRSFAIGLFALALFAVAIDKKFLPVAAIGGIVLVAAWMTHLRQHRSRGGSTDAD